MSRWKSTVVARIRELARARRVLITRKAVQELEELDVSLQAADLPEVLVGLEAEKLQQRVQSEVNGQWLYIFDPEVEGVRVYLKVGILDDCVVISFHEWD